MALVLAIAIAGSSSSSCSSSEVTGALSKQVPPKLVPLYEEAAAKYQLGPKGPAVLAAINFVETSFGENVATSAAGAQGWMAFLPSTFAEWGVDGNGDGTKDIFNAADAIFSAANYLRDSGAPGDWWQAIYAYNHAGWYVDKVLRYARQFAAGGTEAVIVSSASCPVATAPNEAVARMLAEAERLSLRRPQTEYVYGGSHGESPTPANGPFDCSSAISHLFQIAGYGNPTMDTVALASWGEPGPGRWVSFYDKPFGADAHTFVEFMPEVAPPSKRYWGTSGQWFSGHGPGFIPEQIFSADYLAGFLLRHPPGL
ncbi:MAG: lytic transglycosylase domain-containing protein [Actinobacteria bacterium]|nr:lytic transglycosylase domain-containing protein [Actinomycetota bacterium]